MSLQPLRKSSPLPKVRKPLKARVRPMNPALKQRVLERDNFTCQWCKQPGGRLDIHHILRRPHTGKEDRIDLLISVHRLCHDQIHASPNEAVRRGFLIRTGSNP